MTTCRSGTEGREGFQQPDLLGLGCVKNSALRVKNGASFGFALAAFLARGSIQPLGFMYPVTGSVDADDDRMMHHAIHQGRSDHGIAQVFAQGLEVDV